MRGCKTPGNGTPNTKHRSKTSRSPAPSASNPNAIVIGPARSHNKPPASHCRVVNGAIPPNPRDQISPSSSGLTSYRKPSRIPSVAGGNPPIHPKIRAIKPGPRST